MTKHSDLIKADDLHYAKVRLFTGQPATITPDFINQLLISVDTNKIYRASGTAIGNLIESPNAQGDGSQGNGNQNTSPSWIYFSGFIQAEVGRSYIAGTTSENTIKLPGGSNGDFVRIAIQNPSESNVFIETLTAGIWHSSGSFRSYPYPIVDSPSFEWLILDSTLLEFVFVNGGWRVIQGNTRISIYTPYVPILGCTDENALNYNDAANEDDGSCVYS